MVVCCISLSCASMQKFQTSQEQLNHYNFSELEDRFLSESRPVAIFFHTSWCNYCRSMEQTTFQNPDVINLLNNHFYFIPFDGEQKEDVEFRNRHFRLEDEGKYAGTHQLAFELANLEGEMVYPALVILNPNFEIVFQHHAFLNSEEMSAVLNAATKE